MRLYAFLGQSLAASDSGISKRGKCTGTAEATSSLSFSPEAEYAQWVETYSSADFESLASSLEHLLDRYSTEEGTATDELSPAYRRAMQLEHAFFSAQPGLHVRAVPALRPRVLAVDFDQTVTEEDTSALIVAASIRGEPDVDAAARLEVLPAAHAL
jgi:hypothetical protein